MPEPNTVTAPPDEPDPQAGTTAGWAAPSPSANAPAPRPVTDPTLTRTVASTPGPAHPQRLTYSDDTERVLGVSEPERLPDIPGFRVEAVIGYGGMGVVYRAVHLEMDRAVALKVIYPRGHHGAAQRARFQREVQALAGIEHPNVVPIYHAGEWLGFPYFTMKLVPGGPLSRHLDRFTGRYAEIATLVAKVARAVQALHDRKLIHRDLKPLNILLGDGDEPLVADFGLAKWLDDPDADLSVTGVPVGTRQYMPPEQTLGLRAEYTEACDVWALGVTLYEMLAGARPFSAPSDPELFEQIRTADPPPLPAGTPAELAAVVQKCLQKAPRDRYSSAAAVAEDLEGWLAGRGVSAPLPVREPTTSRWRWVWLALVALGAAVVVAVSWPPPGGAGGGTPPPPRNTSPADERLVPTGPPPRTHGKGAVKLTDEMGKPRSPLTFPPGFALPEFAAPGTGEHTFTSSGMGVGLLGELNLPLPVLLSAEVEFTAGRPRIPFVGVVVGGRRWEGERSGSHSFVRVVARPEYGDGGANPELACAVELFWRPVAAGGNLMPAPGQAFRVPTDPGPGRWKTTIVVEIHNDRIASWVHGRPLPEVQADWALDELRRNLATRNDRAVLGATPFTPPAFGPAVGVTVGDTNAVFRNLTVSPIP